MVYRAPLLFLTVCKAAVALQCSTQQLVNGSGAPDLQQAITMAYCYIDDCIVTIPALESFESYWTLSTPLTASLCSFHKETRPPRLSSTRWKMSLIVPC